MNIVMDEEGQIIEVQGTAEKDPFTREEMDKFMDLAEKGINDLIKEQKKSVGLK
jgi:ribonuclease PH